MLGYDGQPGSKKPEVGFAARSSASCAGSTPPRSGSPTAVSYDESSSTNNVARSVPAETCSSTRSRSSSQANPDTPTRTESSSTTSMVRAGIRRYAEVVVVVRRTAGALELAELVAPRVRTHLERQHTVDEVVGGLAVGVTAHVVDAGRQRCHWVGRHGGEGSPTQSLPQHAMNASAGNRSDAGRHPDSIDGAVVGGSAVLVVVVETEPVPLRRRFVGRRRDDLRQCRHGVGRHGVGSCVGHHRGIVDRRDR